MKAIKAISAGLLSLFMFATAHAQETKVIVKKTAPVQKKVVTKKVTKTGTAVPKAEVTVTKSHSGYRYDRGTRRYYRVTEGRKVYYREGWTPSR